MHEAWAERFWARVDKVGPVPPHKPELGACWVWTGSKLPDKGYGRFSPAWKVGLYAHRVSWELANGRSIPDGLDILHACDNTSCVRPGHLSVGTGSENMQDMLAKGRAGRTGSPGERHPAHKLTEVQVRDIRGRWAAGGVRQRDLAAEFGVSRGLVGMIVRRAVWAHVP